MTPALRSFKKPSPCSENASTEPCVFKLGDVRAPGMLGAATAVEGRPARFRAVGLVGRGRRGAGVDPGGGVRSWCRAVGISLSPLRNPPIASGPFVSLALFLVGSPLRFAFRFRAQGLDVSRLASAAAAAAGASSALVPPAPASASSAGVSAPSSSSASARVLGSEFRRERLRADEIDDPRMRAYVERRLEEMRRAEGGDAGAGGAGAGVAGTGGGDAGSGGLASGGAEGPGTSAEAGYRPRGPSSAESASVWGAGIAEVPLGVEDRLAAVERAEAAKRSAGALGGGAGLLAGADGELTAPSTRRRNFPVSFGKQDPAALARIERARRERERRAEAVAEKRARKRGDA